MKIIKITKAKTETEGNRSGEKNSDEKNLLHKVINFTDIGIFEGLCNKNIPHGPGKLKLKNGDFFEGEFVAGQFHGQGRMITSDGCEYNGRWQENCRNGKGTERWANGDFYEGDFKGDKKDGYGKFLWSNGCSYEGSFRNGEFEGFGIYKWQNEKTYEGDWKEGKMNGKGTMTYANGDSFEGNFHKGKKHGKGLFKWAAEGNYYDGEWNNNVPHGIGYVGSESVSRRKAMFENGANVLWMD